MSIDVLKERPQETGTERYLITNGQGDTIYAYWKVLYEEITEEFLYDSYVIKNVELSKKGQRRKESSDLCRSVGTDKLSDSSGRSRDHEEASGGFRRWSRNAADSMESSPNIVGGAKKNIASFTPSTQTPALAQFADPLLDKRPRKYSHNGECKDDMDTLGTVYNKATKKARKKSLKTGQETESRCSTNLLKRSIYVPIGLCVKTANPSSDKAELLLDSLIDILLVKDGNYVSNLHNMIYSFSEFCSTILSLTQISSPPPFTSLQIPLTGRDVVYYEGLVSNLPCEGDISIAQMFSLIEPDDVLTLWTALLLERDVIIYVPDANLYFFIAKPLMHLMFPLTWPFAKGIIPNMDLFSTPTPFCFGTNIVTKALRRDKVGLRTA